MLQSRVPFSSTSQRLAPRRGAVSTEMVVVLCLIAVAVILCFMMLGQQLRNHAKNTVDKVGGQAPTKAKSQGVDTFELNMAVHGGDGNSMLTGLGNPDAQSMAVQPIP